MNYCIAQPIEKYSVNVNGIDVGLYQSYKDRPALLAAVLLMTTVPFQYESTSTVPGPLRGAKLEPYVEGLLADTLISCVGRKMVLTLLEYLSPLDFYNYLEGFDLSHLPIRKFYSSDENLRLIIRARVGAWAIYSSDGKMQPNGIFENSYNQVINFVNGGK